MRKTIKTPLFPSRLVIFDDMQQAIDEIERVHGMYYDEAPAAFAWESPDGCIYMAFDEVDANTIAHESLHAAWYVCDRAGVKLDRGNHEAQAYMLGWIVETVTKFLGRL